MQSKDLNVVHVFCHVHRSCVGLRLRYIQYVPYKDWTVPISFPSHFLLARPAHRVTLTFRSRHSRVATFANAQLSTLIFSLISLFYALARRPTREVLCTMENKVLPAVRVPTIPAGDPSDDGSVSETPIVDLPPSEKFGFAYPDRPMITPILPPHAQRAAPEADSSEHETSEAESQDESSTPPVTGGRDSADRTPSNEIPDSNTTPVPSPSPPRLSRAFSMPLTSQLGHLRNPHRTPALTGPRDAYFVPPSPLALAQSPDSTRLQELSVELADSVQMVIQTLLQISPPHLLDPAKEQFSACSLSVPSPSITAMLTAMKNLNYMSANMTTFSDDLKCLPGLTTPEQGSPTAISISQDDFDVGEMLQSVGDALSGVAAQAGVELVLYHADVGMKHVSVRGDECGVSYALSHVR